MNSIIVKKEYDKRGYTIYYKNYEEEWRKRYF